MIDGAGLKGRPPASGYGLVLCCLAWLSLTGCAADNDMQTSSSLMPSPPNGLVPGSSTGAGAPAIFTAENSGPSALAAAVPLQHLYSPLYSDSHRGSARRAALDSSDRVPAGCSIKDRFDRKHALAYNFADGQSRVGLSLKGVDLKTLTSLEVEAAFIEFKFKLQPIKDRKERCRYRSGWQGWGGSVYNELFLRQNDTIWRELRDRNLDFWN